MHCPSLHFPLSEAMQLARVLTTVRAVGGLRDAARALHVAAHVRDTPNSPAVKLVDNKSDDNKTLSQRVSETQATVARGVAATRQALVVTGGACMHVMSIMKGGDKMNHHQKKSIKQKIS